MDSMDPVATLGEDIVLLILDHLAPADVLAFCSVSRSWRDFVDDHDVWRRICRRTGIDVREHLHAQEERAAIARGEQYSGELTREANANDCRSAYLDTFPLAKAWEERHMYETLVKAPAFKLRSIYIDHGEDYIYALTETTVSAREECLLVLNKYTGNLLQRIPGITPHATVTVGAGYIAVSQHQRDSPRDRRREYSPLGTVTVFRTATAAGRTGAQWRDRGPLEFACHLTDDGVRRSGKMAVGVVRGQGVLVAADEHTAHLINLDTGNRTSIALERVDTIDSPLFSDRNLKDKEAKVWSVNITDEYVFVVTQYQVHIFTHIGEKLAAYPDPCADYLAHAGLGFGVEARYPYGSLFKPAPKTPASAPPGFSLAWTLQWTLEGAHPDSHEFAEATEGAFAYPSEWDDDHSDDSSDWHLEERFRFEGMNAWLQDVSFTTDDLVIRGRQGGIFIVRDYRRVLREVRDVEEYRERTAYIGRHTVVIGFRESNDVVACYGNRIAVHAADTVVFLIDTTQLPSMPWLGDEDDQPCAVVYAFEVSSLEGMQDESSVVMDARGIYMADWDIGMPGHGIEYEDMNEIHRDEDSWPFAIRPNWGCIKAWIFRPTGALLHRPYAKAWAEADHHDHCSHTWTLHFPSEVHVAPDWQDVLDGVAAMLGEDVSWQEGDGDEWEDEEDGEGEEGAENGENGEEGGHVDQGDEVMEGEEERIVMRGTDREFHESAELEEAGPKAGEVDAAVGETCVERGTIRDGVESYLGGGAQGLAMLADLLEQMGYDRDTEGYSRVA